MTRFAVRFGEGKGMRGAVWVGLASVGLAMQQADPTDRK